MRNHPREHIRRTAGAGLRLGKATQGIGRELLTGRRGELSQPSQTIGPCGADHSLTRLDTRADTVYGRPWGVSGGGCGPL
jgi:hypothetical protein